MATLIPSRPVDADTAAFYVRQREHERELQRALSRLESTVRTKIDLRQQLAKRLPMLLMGGVALGFFLGYRRPSARG